MLGQHVAVVCFSVHLVKSMESVTLIWIYCLTKPHTGADIKKSDNGAESDPMSKVLFASCYTTNLESTNDAVINVVSEGIL